MAKSSSEAIDYDYYWRRREGISTDSGTTVETFRPVIPWQAECLNAIRNEYDYSVGTHDVLLSGSVGSAKSILLAHIVVTHCLMYPKACAGIFRLSFPDLRDTLFKDIVDHLESENLIEGRDYWINNTRCTIAFKNGSTIVSRSFSDGRYTKVRSLRLSLAVFEELTEFKGKHQQAFFEVKNRLGRCPHVPENLCISATNPDDPSMWVHEYFMDSNDPTRHVYYSLTFDNPFLQESYIRTILRTLDEKQVLRMVFGRWIELKTEVIYYQFGDYNVVKKLYSVDCNLPIHISWDFNIGSGKPMSCIVYQTTIISGLMHYHFFDEVVIEGMRTLDSCEEIADKGILDNYSDEIIVHGDASGAHSDTRSKKNDYDIIMGFLQNYVRKDGKKLRVTKRVPLANPPIRKRHNTVNGLCKNVLGEVRLFIYQNCKDAIKGMKLTKLKDNGSLIEDDSFHMKLYHSLWLSLCGGR